MIAAPGPAPLDQRIAAQSVMSQLLKVHERDIPRSRLGRIFGADPLSADSRRWYQGALGEIEVGKLLAKLGPGWTVLHAVPVGTGESDIDHVVIGAAGVFTINTKHHADKSVWVAGRTLMVSGQKQDHIRNSVHEAGRAGKLLSAAAGFTVPVEPLIVIVGAKDVKMKASPAGTTVLTARQLLRWLKKRPAVLNDGAVSRIAASANRAGTWHRTPRDAGLSAEILDGFSQVHGSVQAARRRRRTWGYAFMAGVLIAAFTLFAAIPNIVQTHLLPLFS